MHGFKSSIHRDLNDFMCEVDGGTFNIRHVSKGAFTKARAKLKPEAFVELNQKAVNSFYQRAPWLDWHDRRLLVVDGTRLRLPRSGSIEDEFSLYLSGAGEDPMCMALASFVSGPAESGGGRCLYSPLLSK